jgi:uncharacterized protein YbbC (DUF1343 family)
VQVYITDPAGWRPIETWLAIIGIIHDQHPADFAWLPPGTDGVEQGSMFHFDRLMGSASYRRNIESGVSLTRLTAGWDAVCRDFREQSRPFWLYH